MVKLTRVDSVGHFDPKKTLRHAIYSIDFQPFGGRLATAGGDCTVKLWNTEYVLSDQSQTMSDCLLATLSTHSKSVNVVRWSPDGRFLASGSDDCYIIIYRYTPDAISTQPFGSNALKNKETWSRCFTLQGHTMDVLDICWSSRGILASASVDNNIMIWDFRSEMSSVAQGNSYYSAPISPFKILSGHLSFVKGVSFDPIGRYLASSGGDNLIILWDCDSWIQLHCLEGPLKNSLDRSIFRRLSWAPDGNSLCITGGTKSSKPVGMVLERGSWVCAADLVGHEAATVCCRFCPYVLTKNVNKDEAKGCEGKSKDSAPYCCLVLGDQLGVVSLWSSDKQRPMLDLKEAFQGAATDISWTLRESLESLAPSLVFAVGALDGTVLFVQLGTDIGVSLSAPALEKHYRCLYGRGQSEMLAEQTRSTVPNPTALKYLKEAQKKKNAGKAGGGVVAGVVPPSSISRILATAESTVPASNVPQPSVLSQQLQSKRTDGKKRIQPVLISQRSGGQAVGQADGVAPSLSSYMITDNCVGDASRGCVTGGSTTNGNIISNGNSDSIVHSNHSDDISSHSNDHLDGDVAHSAADGPPHVNPRDKRRRSDAIAEELSAFYGHEDTAVGGQRDGEGEGGRCSEVEQMKDIGEVNRVGNGEGVSKRLKQSNTSTSFSSSAAASVRTPAATATTLVTTAAAAAAIAAVSSLLSAPSSSSEHILLSKSRIAAAAARKEEIDKLFAKRTGTSGPPAQAPLSSSSIPSSSSSIPSSTSSSLPSSSSSSSLLSSSSSSLPFSSSSSSSIPSSTSSSLPSSSCSAPVMSSSVVGGADVASSAQDSVGDVGCDHSGGGGGDTVGIVSMSVSEAGSSLGGGEVDEGGAGMGTGTGGKTGGKGGERRGSSQGRGEGLGVKERGRDKVTGSQMDKVEGRDRSRTKDSVPRAPSNIASHSLSTSISTYNSSSSMSRADGGHTDPAVRSQSQSRVPSGLLSVTYASNDITCSIPHPSSSPISALVRTPIDTKTERKGLLHLMRNIPQRTFLKSCRLSPPTQLLKMKNVCVSALSSVSMRREGDSKGGASSSSAGSKGNHSSSSHNVNSSYGNRDVGNKSSSSRGDDYDDQCTWKSVVAGSVSSLAGSLFPTPPPSLHALHPTHSSRGVCAVGCTDGTLHLLSLDSGLRLAPPMVLGACLVVVDVCPLVDCLRILAVTMDGELWVWEMSDSEALHEGDLQTGRGGKSNFLCVARSSVKPALASMKHRSCQPTLLIQDIAHSGVSKDISDGDIVSAASSSSSSSSHSTHVSLQECYLTLQGKVAISLLSSEVEGRDSAGGPFQSFEFDEMSHVWIRTADLRHSLSTLFSTSFYSDDNASNGTGSKGPKESARTGSNRWVERTGSSATVTASMQSKQAAAAVWGNFGLSEVLKVARATLEISSSRPSNSADHGSSSYGDSGKAAGMTVGEWSSLVTCSYLEERLSLSVPVYGGSEAEGWLERWCTVCCQAGRHDKVKSAANELLRTAQRTLASLSSSSSYPPAPTSSSAPSSSTIYLQAPGEEVVEFKSNGWNWVQTCDHDFRINVIREYRCEYESENQRRAVLVAGASGDAGTERGWRASRPCPRPPSLCLLEDVLMPAVAECCVSAGATLDSSTYTRSQTLLAAVDEGISFLRDDHSLV